MAPNIKVEDARSVLLLVHDFCSADALITMTDPGVPEHIDES
jgi:hypothetical protein